MFALIPMLASSLMAPPQLVPPSVPVMTGVRSLALSPDGSQIAFTYRGDVWVASSDGGRAFPVTDHVEMDDNPIWSPDGKWIAFATDRHGSWDIYAVPVDGGESKRLTYYSGSEIPNSWSPDGKEILMDASFEKGFAGVYGLDVSTGRLREITLTQFRLEQPVFSPDGSQIVYANKAMFSWVRPRYEGSGAGQIWVMNRDGSNNRSVRASGQQHLWTQFSPDGRRLLTVTATDKTPSSRRIDEKPAVFADSLERTPNVHEVDPANGRVRRLTNLVGGAGPRFLTVAGNGLMAYEYEGKVYTMRSGEQPKKVEFHAVVDAKQATFERQILTTGATGGDVTPDFKTAVFVVNREIWSVPVTRGKGPNGADATQLTDYPGTDTDPVIAPDGKTLFFVSDRDGANSLYKMDMATKAVEMFYKTTTDITGLELMPGGTGLSFWVAGRDGGLFTIPVAGGTAKRILDKPWRGSYAFSPDNKYVSYERPLPGSGFKYWENGRNVWVKNLSTGEDVNVSRLNLPDGDPAWSADGKYLYFTSSREGGGIFVIPADREEARSTELEMKYTKPAGPVSVDFDLEGASTRIRRLVAGPSQGPIVMDPENGALYFRRSGSIWRADYDGENVREVGNTAGTAAFKLSADKNKLAMLGGGSFRYLDLRKQGMPVSTVEFRADWTRDLVKERYAAFHEFWRAYNLGFYDEYFHRRDWAKIRDRYLPLLDSVGHRREMASVLNMMVHELEASHSEVGPAPGGVNGESTAHPGFTIDYSYAGPGVRIKDVPARSPGSYAKTKLEPGEYVMAINGQDVGPDQSLFMALNGQTGRDITLLVSKSGTKTGAREVKYRALSGGQFSGILYDNRIEWRRKYVEEKSGGRLTYVHIAGMGGGNLETFNNEMWEYVNGKDGVVIDVRENGGGNIADVLVDALERRMHMRYLPRDADEEKGPGRSWGDKPAVVMHAETSFSNAEMFPAAMKALGLAELVGMPTPGYVIYTSGGRLVDGTSIRMPGTGVYRVDGSPTENLGQVPDHRVDITPEQYMNNQDPQLDKAIEVLMRKMGR